MPIRISVLYTVGSGNAAPKARCGQRALQERRIRKQIREWLRVEDVCMQQVFPALNRVRKPGETPHAEERIDVTDDVSGEHTRVRPGRDDRGDAQSDDQQAVVAQLATTHPGPGESLE